MIINTSIISIILVAVLMLSLGVKLLFNRDAKIISHSCALDDGLDNEVACSKCQLKDLVDCPENKKKI